MSKDNVTNTKFFNLSEACKEIGISRMTLWRWIESNKVIPIRIAGLPFLTSEQVESLKDGNKKHQTPVKASGV